MGEESFQGKFSKIKLKVILIIKALDKTELYWLREELIIREIFLKRITVLRGPNSGMINTLIIVHQINLLFS